MKKETFKRMMLLLLCAGTCLCCMTSCSDDDDEQQTVPIENVVSDGQTFQLTEDGTVEIPFTVAPANAEVTGATVRLSTEIGTEAFEVTSLSSKGNGKWQATVKVNDFTKVGATQQATLTLSQSIGFTAGTTITIEDPYNVGEKIVMEAPKAVSIASAEDNKPMQLPVIFTSQEDQSLLDGIDLNYMIFKETSIVNHVDFDKFDIIPMKDRKGFLIGVKADKLEDVKAGMARYETISYQLYLPCKFGRFFTAHLHFMLCDSQFKITESLPLVPEGALTVSAAELATAGFTRYNTINVYSPLRHLGLTDLDHLQPIENIGFTDAEGNDMDEYCFALTNFRINKEESNVYNAEVGFFDVENHTFVPGKYYDTYRFREDWTYDGVAYPVVCGDLVFELNVK